MTTENETNEKKVAPQALPWLVAAGALVIYLVTLNHWATLGNLSQLVQLGRWDGQLPVYAPLYFAVTYPLSWLPVSWHPLALNIFAVVCAVLTLALLARSVMLLPHDRTQEQRLREHSDFSLPGSTPGHGCNLTGADLSQADLEGAKLGAAILGEANLERANLRRATLTDAATYIRPDDSVEVGGCIIDLRNGTLDASLEARLSLMDLRSPKRAGRPHERRPRTDPRVGRDC